MVFKRGDREFRMSKGNDASLQLTCATCATSTKIHLGGNGGDLEAFVKEHEHPAPTAPEPGAVVEAVIVKLRHLAGDELAVVALVVDGLVLGKVPYGQLDVATDKRDLGQEAIDEGRDQIVYDAADLLRRVRRRARGAA